MRNYFLLAALAAAAPLPAVVIYDNLTPTGYQTPFTPAPPLPSGSINYTGMFADDITPLFSPTGWNLTQIDLWIRNRASSATPSAVGLSIWATDGTGGGPGTLLFSAIAATLVFGPGDALASFYPGAPLPSGSFWLGFNFSNFDDTSVNELALNQLQTGVNFLGAPSVGSTATGGWFSSTAGYFGSANPAGLRTTNVNNFAVRIYGDPVATPEPATLALTGAALALLACHRRRR